MKKVTLLILGMSTLNAAHAGERVLGNIVAVERTFAVLAEDCQNFEEHSTNEDSKNYLCRAHVTQKSTLDQKVSSQHVVQDKVDGVGVFYASSGDRESGDYYVYFTIPNAIQKPDLTSVLKTFLNKHAIRTESYIVHTVK